MLSILCVLIAWADLRHRAVSVLSLGAFLLLAFTQAEVISPVRLSLALLPLLPLYLLRGPPRPGPADLLFSIGLGLLFRLSTVWLLQLVSGLFTVAYLALTRRPDAPYLTALALLTALWLVAR